LKVRLFLFSALIVFTSSVSAAFGFEKKDWDGEWKGYWEGTAETSITVKNGRVTSLVFQGQQQVTGKTRVTSESLIFGIGKGYKVELRPRDNDLLDADYSREGASAHALLLRLKSGGSAVQGEAMQ
jgi:hypothetical protein